MRAGAGTVSNQFVRRLVAIAGLMGADAPALMDAIGVSPSLRCAPAGRLPLATLHALFDECARRTADCFGLRAAELVVTHAETALGLAVHGSASLGEAYRRAARYAALLNDTLEVPVEIEGD